jgi:hypothetical protein
MPGRDAMERMGGRKKEYMYAPQKLTTWRDVYVVDL